jgi:hypothetical protein
MYFSFRHVILPISVSQLNQVLSAEYNEKINNKNCTNLVHLWHFLITPSTTLYFGCFIRCTFYFVIWCSLLNYIRKVVMLYSGTRTNMGNSVRNARRWLKSRNTVTLNSLWGLLFVVRNGCHLCSSVHNSWTDLIEIQHGRLPLYICMYIVGEGLIRP